MMSKFILLRTKKSRLSVRDGIELLKQKCVSNLLSGITLFTLTFYQKYSPFTTTANTDLARKPQNYGKVYFNLYGDLGSENRKPAFKVGDRVRISKYKRKTFDKGYTPNWTEEVFIIDETQWINPITYKIKDLNGEPIKGTFYREELQKTDQEVYRIEKFIRKTKDKALVKWKGYPDQFNSWVSLKDLTNLY